MGKDKWMWVIPRFMSGSASVWPWLTEPIPQALILDSCYRESILVFSINNWRIAGDTPMPFDNRGDSVGQSINTFASMLALISDSEGFMNSSSKISPGWTGRIPFFTISSSP